jgi:hypothetical protein
VIPKAHGVVAQVLHEPEVGLPLIQCEVRSTGEDIAGVKEQQVIIGQAAAYLLYDAGAARDTVQVRMGIISVQYD